jgi:hypothetical protein
VSYGLISVVGLGKYENKRNGLVVGLLHVIRLKWAWFSSGWPVRKAQWPKACLVASSLLGRWIRQGETKVALSAQLFSRHGHEQSSDWQGKSTGRVLQQRGKVEKDLLVLTLLPVGSGISLCCRSTKATSWGLGRTKKLELD